MSEKHSFTATYALLSFFGHVSNLTISSERQYKYRFPGLKNVKEDEWAYIEEEMRTRDALGKSSLPCLHGHPLPPGRVSRGMARVRVARSGVTKQPSSRKFTATGLEYRLLTCRKRADNAISRMAGLLFGHRRRFLRDLLLRVLSILKCLSKRNAVWILDTRQFPHLFCTLQ
jgi:hypothetical protein